MDTGPESFDETERWCGTEPVPVDGPGCGETPQRLDPDECSSEPAQGSQYLSEPNLLGGAVETRTTSEDVRTEDDELPGSEPESPPEKDRPNRWSQWGPIRRWQWYRANANMNHDFMLRRDSMENAQGRLPPDESLSVPAVWIAELYTPSTVAGLLDGIHQLGWEHGRTRSDSLAKWMNDVRQGRSAGWTNLGLVSPTKTQHFMSDRVAELPDGVKAALPSLMSLTPSITALTICFMLDDASASAVNEPLRADYQTYTLRDPLLRRRHVFGHVLWGRQIRIGRTIHSPDFQRRDASAKVLDSIEARCERWLNDNLPGVFAAGLRGGRYPTATLILSERSRPLTDEARSLRAFEGLGVHQSFDAWESNEWPGVRAVLPRSWRAEGLRIAFAGCRAEAFPPAPGYPEPDSNWMSAQRANDTVPGLVTRWALTCLLDGYHQMLSAQRDRSAQKVRNSPVKDLRRLRNLVRRDLYDLLLSASEIRSFAESGVSYRFNVLELQYIRTPAGQPTIALLDQLANGQVSRARQVEDEARLFLSTATASTDITQTISNIRIQRSIGFFTLISIAVAAVALIVAIAATK